MQHPVLPAAASPAARDRYRQAQTWLLISLASSVLCASLCLGVGGAIFCYLAMQAVSDGQLQDAEDKLKWGRILTLVGSAVGVLSILVSLVLR
jgi:hypothetical protein